MTPLRFFIVCLAIAVAIPALRVFGQEEGPVAADGTWTDATLRHDGMTRHYRVFEPDDLPADAPVVFVLHGGAGSMRKITRADAPGIAAWPAVCAREGALLVVPNGAGRLGRGDAGGDRQSWNDVRGVGGVSAADDVGFLTELVARVVDAYGVDADRVFVTGASNGGMMTYRLLIERPDLFAAGAAFIATLPRESPHLAVPESPTPLLIVNGTDDPLIKWDGGPIFSGRGDQRSTPATVEWWVAANRAWAELAETEELPDRDPDDGCRVSLTKYPAAEAGAEVWFAKVDGGGHCMPSIAHPLRDGFLVRRMIGTMCRDVEGAELAWEFFERHGG